MGEPWEEVEKALVARLDAMVPAARHVSAGTTEEWADEAPKDYPALVVVFTGARNVQRHYAGSGGEFSSLADARYKILGYAGGGRQDDQARYGTSGIYALMQATFDAINGFAPLIANNAWFFYWESTESSRPFLRRSGTGGLKMEQEYSLQQTILGRITA